MIVCTYLKETTQRKQSEANKVSQSTIQKIKDDVAVRMQKDMRRCDNLRVVYPVRFLDCAKESEQERYWMGHD